MQEGIVNIKNNEYLVERGYIFVDVYCALLLSIDFKFFVMKSYNYEIPVAIQANNLSMRKRGL